MGERGWTTEQLQAITERGKNILVSAGAGSGKTAVMVERATRLILENRVPVSGMLIVTFTDAAAAEMRERLRQALKGRLADTISSGGQSAAGDKTCGQGAGVSQENADIISEREWIRKQLDDLHNAQISTFHSFAQRVIREFFYLIDIEPGPRVLDEAEAEVLKEEALEELFDSEYEENNDDFRAFLDSYSGEKNDNDARQLILDLYRKLAVIPEGLDLLDEKIGELELDADGFKKTKACEELLKLCRRDFDAALGIASSAEKLLRDEGLDRLADLVVEDENAIKDAASEDSVDGMARAAKAIKYITMTARKDEKESYILIQKKVKALRDSYKAKVGEVCGICYADLDTMTKVMQMTAPYAHTISRLIRRFDQLFREIKNDRKGIDYSDMEHFAYEILQHKEAADYYRELFQYIFIDEYQDTNYMQETIVGMIAREDNVFMVGDIKQSIYHFRLADPEIFQAKYDEFSKGKANSIKIDLNMNFRSKAPVIREINNIFRPLMDGYDKEAELVCGVVQGEHALPEPKTYIVDRTAPKDDAQLDDAQAAAGAGDGTIHKAEDAALKITDDAAGAGKNAKTVPNNAAGAELEDIKKEELEAREAAQIIRENLGMEYTDPGSGKSHKVDYRDIVILMRSFKRSAEGYRDVFREAGIPLYIDENDGYFDTIEINVALALLTVIDNKRQDVPFIALLRSEIFGFTCEELALIRKLHRDVSYVEAAEAVAAIAGNCATGEEAASTNRTGIAEKALVGNEAASTGQAGSEPPEALRRKCRQVFDDIKKWQTYAVTMPLADMIWRILNETGYYVIAGTFPGGAGRQANLRLLTDRAREYSERSLSSLYGFIRYIDTLKKNKVKIPQATLLSENDNVVRIMTIHHSKGLEFPVVILAGMDNQPKGNQSGEVNFDREIGLGLRAKDSVRHLKEDTLVRRIIAAKDRQAETDELKRVFYVAVTRAREAFYLLGASDYKKIIDGLDSGQHSDTTLLKMAEYLPEIVDVPGTELISKPLSPDTDAAPASPSDEETAGAADKISEKKVPETADRISEEEIIARLDYSYPHAAAGDLAAKTSVTGLNQAKMRSAVITGPGEDAADAGRLIKPDVPGMDENEHASDPAERNDQKTANGQAGNDKQGSGQAESGRFDDIVPAFMRDSRKITAAEIGTVYHKIMEKLDFSRAGKEGYVYIAGAAAELVAAGLFTEEEIKAVDIGKIEAFFKTDLGQRCIAASEASMLHKEQTFESKIKVGEEDVLVQGVIDCWLEENDKEILIDYKTNRVDRNKSLDEEKARITDMYRTQLEMYADAIEKATGKPVMEKYLYLFDIGEAVEVR